MSLPTAPDPGSGFSTEYVQAGSIGPFLTRWRVLVLAAIASANAEGHRLEPPPERDLALYSNVVLACPRCKRRLRLFGGLSYFECAGDALGIRCAEPGGTIDG